ncbi:PilD-dependent protein PddA [Anaerohalosphaera lusitana]|uniref:PilD-dependent protein PddA n=1 Tax=Anaerohalosphaera lusitana TaxID=1936003 RepID=A0A1U9NNU8_9BACT|nr:type II secretion system protein [Anaerohalosphaera lusitana]AQT69583.1 PilD-dependent protein PddA [Anaerohalosphaera lusitana]
MKRKGFTLVELMVVVLIVAILAAVAVPIIRGRIDAAKWSEGKAIMGSIATAIRTYAAEQGTNGTLPTSLDDLGFASGDCTGTYFTDSDFQISVSSLGGGTGDDQYVQFSITCPGGSQTNAPGTPENGYVLTANSDGTMSWAIGS